jgi:Zn-finger protein
MDDINTEWLCYFNGYDDYETCQRKQTSNSAPLSGELNISTKTKISHISSSIDLFETFWKLPVVPYHHSREGIIKKQMKFGSTSEAELALLETTMKEKMAAQPNYVDVMTITDIRNPKGMTKFKVTQKISIGLNKKDILNFRCKKKSAFYNCFVVILRITHGGTFKEINIKVFNTGKLEIPGIQEDEILDKVLSSLTMILAPIIGKPELYYSPNSETVLINSNFKCNFFIQRNVLVDILSSKYNIKCSYEPCSYPGIQCTFYYDPLRNIQTGSHSDQATDITKVSFMIFRTGSVLIVGKCTESILYEIYHFISDLLKEEYSKICDVTDSGEQRIETDVAPISMKKRRRRTIYIS